MSFHLALPRKAPTSSRLQVHPQRNPQLTNASTRLQTFDLQHQSKHKLINTLDRIGQFSPGFGTERAH